jgi:hypothetical protein
LRSPLVPCKGRRCWPIATQRMRRQARVGGGGSSCTDRPQPEERRRRSLRAASLSIDPSAADQVPGVVVSVDEPLRGPGAWFIDVKKGKQVVDGRVPAQVGFGLFSTPSEGSVRDRTSSFRMRHCSFSESLARCASTLKPSAAIFTSLRDSWRSASRSRRRWRPVKVAARNAMPGSSPALKPAARPRRPRLPVDWVGTSSRSWASRRARLEAAVRGGRSRRAHRSCRERTARHRESIPPASSRSAFVRKRSRGTARRIHRPK